MADKTNTKTILHGCVYEMPTTVLYRGCGVRGEAKNLPPHSVLGSGRNTFCAIRLDREEIYRTTTVEKSLDPFYGEEFSGEIPRKFRYLSFYICDKTDKVLGKISIRKKDLHKYHNKEHWFPLLPVEANPDVQGKVQLEIRFDEYLNTNPDATVSHRLAVRIIECSDLPVTNGACNPYAVVTVNYGKVKSREEVKRTNVKKKTICPQFEETFFFDLENKGQNHDRNNYFVEDNFKGELSVSLWHDDSRVSREVLGSIFPGVFLGEVRLRLQDLEARNVEAAWYFLRPRSEYRQSYSDTGSLRLNISYHTEHVFSSQYYNDLRNLLLRSVDTEPVTSSAAFILSRVVDHLQDAAQPLVKIFLHHRKLVPFVQRLAEHEISRIVDHNTLFRGNTLLTKLLDELLKLVGLPYLHHTLKPTIDQICTDHLPCEIDPTRLREGENINDNMHNLQSYIEQILHSITSSGLMCPTSICEVFFALRELVENHFPENEEIRYQVVSGFIFLRFFAPAILGPKFFDLNDCQDENVTRTLKLISKAIQWIGNIVSTKTMSVALKEDYMVPLFHALSDITQTEAVKMYLDIISSSSKAHSKKRTTGEVPVVLKEGDMQDSWMSKKAEEIESFANRKDMKKFHDALKTVYGPKSSGTTPLLSADGSTLLTDKDAILERFCMFCAVLGQDISVLTKRAQGRKKFGMKNFKQRYFCLTNQVLMYTKHKGGMPLCVIPIEDILAVEQLQEESFKMKYMFQVIQPERALYVQATNCIEEKEWLDILGKVCAANQNRLNLYHPAAFINGHWLCCKASDPSSEGCEPVSGGIPITNIKLVIDTDREVEKIHSLFLQNMEKLEAMQDACGALEVYSGTKFSVPIEIEDTKSCFEMINAILKCVISLEQEHLQYRKAVQRETISGSFAKIVVHLQQGQPGRPSGPSSSSPHNFIRLSFRESGEAEFFRCFNQTLRDKKWDQPILPPSQPGASGARHRPGIVGIERSIQQKQKDTDKSITQSFKDLQNLMEKAKEMVSLSKTIVTKIRDKQGEITEDETVKFKQYLLSMGIPDPVTRESHGTGDKYLTELARQLATVLESPIKDLGGMMTLTDVYCRVNRARGMELLSPEDLLNACEMFEYLKLPIRLRIFDSGVMVLQSRDHSEDKVIKNTAAIVDEKGSLTAEELAQHIGLSVILAKERLLLTEKNGGVCRDDTVEGLRFFPNLFLTKAS